MNTIESKDIPQFLSGGGEMGTLIRSMDWSKTALGPIEDWPQSLRTSVSLCLSSTFPILIAWGPEKIQIYNDSYRPICGDKHPTSMGQNFRICWETALEVVGDAFSRGELGEGTYINDQRMFLDRHGYLEEAFMTFSFAPIRDESGGVGGIFHPITETTVKMLSARRTKVLRDLGAALGEAKSIQDIAAVTRNLQPECELDLPFLMLYQLDSQQNSVKLISTSGLPNNSKLTPESLNLIEATGSWPLQQWRHSGNIEEVRHLTSLFEEFECQPYPECPSSAVILPIRISGQDEAFCFLIAGVSARRALDSDYRNFYEQLLNTYNTAFSNVYAYEQELKRAEALAEIDRAKTQFFSNISHEFRTPLTLMLGPLEDILQQETLPVDLQAPLQATHRNALRLLKLVNNLLDYSRVEAGRTQAAYQKVDLGQLTVDLASSFRSIIEKAGMSLVVEAAPIVSEVYVDRQMWEKIVLNLLSNAFKFTWKGSIKIRVYESEDNVFLQVADTGTGIPAKELPYMFERFHRVENASGRTHEGSGIGLSLVHELVLLHGGEIHVDSTEGIGSVFTVSIPLGKAHLPAAKVSEEVVNIDTSALKGAFIQEATSLLQQDNAIEFLPTESAINENPDLGFSTTNIRILVVDDNSDMRAYLERLLEPYFQVELASNGAIAWSSIQSRQPDLVLSDMMMPVMDGKELLHLIRSTPLTVRLPVIFLSARAGAEARIDGLEAGADDYLVKPFAAAELLTKVRAQIKILGVRNQAEQQLRALITNAPVAIAIYHGPNHMVEIANDRMLHYWNRDAQDILGKPLFETIPALVSQKLLAIQDEVYQTGERFVSSEFPITLMRNGLAETNYLNLTIEAIQVDHRITGVMAVAADVTTLINARLALEKTSDTLLLSMEAANLGTWRTDWGTNNLFFSDIAYHLHGIPIGTDLLFDQTIPIILAEYRIQFLAAIQEAVENKGRFSIEYQIQPANGSAAKWLHSTGKVELNEQGAVIGLIGTLLDITESKADSQRKDDFIAMVSHELKTPLTAMSGYAQILQRKAQNNSDDFSADKLDKLFSQLKKMNTLINGFLNVSRLDSGKIHLHAQHFSLRELIEETIDIAQDVTSSHQITYEEEQVVMLSADREKISSVVYNLVGNAVKYSPRADKVIVRSRVADGMVIVSVQDFGMGIKTADIDHLFDRYYRVKSKSMDNIAGFGIGLYLSAEIVQRHYGRIWIESIWGEGSTFYFSLPIA
ncbi:ATP-binding protein [Sphingobacterium sp. lm-10]|uniref:ATP-binding protein n=1 Tax=Sphingobacterium sp. lm-10 TaxID=2944904 RepID=UPI00202275E8|nr:ATP-binding protein [Sphingobacterium sp. lm-10]MCL7986879.1 ATP-binding protein [Sphingobacterium sp. lm-10]